MLAICAFHNRQGLMHLLTLPIEKNCGVGHSVEKLHMACYVTLCGHLGVN